MHPHGIRPKLRQVAAAAAAGLLAACSEGPLGPGPSGPIDIDLALPWVEASLADVGGSPERMARAVELAGANDRMRSLLVVKDGRLVVEEYFGDGADEELHDVRSVTKSVVSALAGIAIARGDIDGLDDPIGDYLDGVTGRIEPDKRAITVRQLLTMTSGLEWDESGGFGSYIDWIRSGDYLGFVLEKPLTSAPGTQFTYNSGAVHLLGVVIEQATTMYLPNFAQHVLLDPMGIAKSRWESLGGGFHNGGAGLDLRPRDLARFGQLYLQRGSSGGRQIIPADWVDRSTMGRFDWRFDSGSLKGISYGFLWWVAPDAPEPMYFAWGHGGQYVVVVRGLNLVVVTTNNWWRMGEAAEDYERVTMDIVVQHVLPAFR